MNRDFKTADSPHAEIRRAVSRFSESDRPRVIELARQALVLGDEYLTVAFGGRPAIDPGLELQRDVRRASVGLPLKWTRFDGPDDVERRV